MRGQQYGQLNVRATTGAEVSGLLWKPRSISARSGWGYSPTMRPAFSIGPRAGWG